MHSALPRLLSRIRITGDFNCWLWTGARVKPPRGGYAKAKIDGRVHRVHRFLYTALIGPAPPLLDHLCRVRHCVNPNHLQEATVQENTKNGLSGVQQKAKRPIEGRFRRRSISPLMAKRKEQLDKLTRLLGDDVIAGTTTSWSDLHAGLAENMRTPHLIALTYRIERAVAAAYEDGQRIEQRGIDPVTAMGHG